MKNTAHPGATLLITVLIVGAVALVVSISIAMRSMGDLDMAVRTTQLYKTLALAEGCLEQVLLNLWGDKSFATEEETLELGTGTCRAQVQGVEGDENRREVVVQATVGRFARSIRAVIDTSGHRLEMIEWELL